MKEYKKIKAFHIVSSEDDIYWWKHDKAGKHFCNGGGRKIRTKQRAIRFAKHLAALFGEATVSSFVGREYHDNGETKYIRIDQPIILLTQTRLMTNVIKNKLRNYEDVIRDFQNAGIELIYE